MGKVGYLISTVVRLMSHLLWLVNYEWWRLFIIWDNIIVLAFLIGGKKLGSTITFINLHNDIHLLLFLNNCGYQISCGYDPNNAFVLPGGKPVGTTIVNTLTVPSLQRHHLHQSFVCHASNSDLEKAVPITAAVIVDMTCKSKHAALILWVCTRVTWHVSLYKWVPRNKFSHVWHILFTNRSICTLGRI